MLMHEKLKGQLVYHFFVVSVAQQAVRNSTKKSEEVILKMKSVITHQNMHNLQPICNESKFLALITL